MAQLVIQGASMTCSFGTTPSTLNVLPTNLVTDNKMSAATVNDFAPTVNIPPFGMCNTPSNPQVASATAAAQGVLTPQPCIPVTTAPWAPGAPNVTIRGQNALDNMSKCMCAWGGVIQFTNAGQTNTSVP